MDPDAHRYVELNAGADLQGFRQALRVLIWCSIPDEQVTWRVRADPDRFGSEKPDAYGAAGRPLILPRAVADLIRKVVCHSNPRKYADLYEMVWRMRRPANPQPDLYRNADDGLVSRLRAMAQDVSSDMSKMQALLRFREINDPLVGERFIAWFEPDHFIVEETSKFFVERFGSLDWTILTPKGSVWWDRRELAIGPPALRPDAPEVDAQDTHWRIFYESAYNPALTRLNLPDQRTPKKHWRARPSSGA